MIRIRHPRSERTHSLSLKASSIRRFTVASSPSTHFAYTLSSTSTECPARSATSVAGTPAFSQSDTAACRRSYGRPASGEDTWRGHSPNRRGWAGRRDEAAERIRAARAYARRGPASGEVLAWLDAVEAENDTRCGHPIDALRIIAHAEQVLATGTEHQSPQWFTWFSPVRLAAFKGNTQLKAGRYAQARETLTAALEALPTEEGKQRTVILGDLAAIEAAQQNPEVACARAQEALDQLAITWYATGMERIRDVRKALQPWADTDCVRSLDDRLYGWQTTLSALRR